MTRRQFTALAPAFLKAGMAAPSERINVGFIGFGGQGLGRLRGFMQHPDVNVAALCDLDQTHLDKAVALTKEKRNETPKTFKDYREMLAVKDIDAVCVVTPDHWHALPTIQAAEAGKDIFVEKPLSFTIGEGRAMVQAARKHNRVTQMGNHIHNDQPTYRRAVEILKAGSLGKIQRVHCWKSSENKGLGNPPDGTPPQELDYDFWLGPAPKRAYNPNRSHFNYRYFWDYSGGMFMDFWCHITDVVYWGLDLQAPKSVSAIGRRELTDDNGETPNYLEAIYEYPGLTLNWTLNPRHGMPGFEDWGIGAAFEGSEATMLVNYTTIKIYAKGKPVEDFKRPDPSIPNSPGHIREFLDSIKSRAQCTCDVEYGHRLTKGGLLGTIALRTGSQIHWDDAKEMIVDNKEAQALVTRHYRKPWKLA